jgi:hypothetical protein
MFDAWLAARGGSGNREVHHLLEALRRFVVAHGSSRFETIRDPAPTGDGGQVAPMVPDARTNDRAGWKWQEVDAAGARQWFYGFDPAIFALEIAQPLGLHELLPV